MYDRAAGTDIMYSVYSVILVLASRIAYLAYQAIRKEIISSTQHGWGYLTV